MELRGPLDEEEVLPPPLAGEDRDGGEHHEDLGHHGRELQDEVVDSHQPKELVQGLHLGRREEYCTGERKNMLN